MNIFNQRGIDLHTENFNTLLKQLKIFVAGKTSHIHGLEDGSEFIIQPRLSTDSMQSLLQSQ